MTYYNPCRGCKKNDSCKKREGLAEAISGFGVTTLKLKCADREPFLVAGNRVSFSLTFFDDNPSYYDNGAHGVEFHGTVSKETKTNRFLIKVDDGPCVDSEDYGYSSPADINNGRGFLSLPIGRLTKLDEPDLTVFSCGNVEGQKCQDNPCYCECSDTKARGQS